MNVLVLGDDPRSLEFLTLAVRQGNWIPLTALSVQEAILQHEKSPCGLALVETHAPLSEAVRQCQALRQRAIIPVIALVPWTDEASLLALYEAGVDDCIPRPYSPRILQAKIRSFLWWSTGTPHPMLSFIESGDIVLDTEQHTVTVRGSPPVRLTPLEFRLLYALISNAGRVLPADVLVDRIWGYTGEGSRDLLKGLVRRLRSKIEPAGKGTRFIRTIPGVGYSFAPAASNAHNSL